MQQLQDALGVEADQADSGSAEPERGSSNVMRQTDPDSLDPEDFSEFRVQGHRMLDDMIDYLERIRERPVWQTIPDSARAVFREPMPTKPTELSELHDIFMRSVVPFSTGNVHPGFMGWVHGAGTPVGMLAEMLAGGLNANLGGRDQMPLEVERQVVRWVRELFGFPETASGLFVTGSSMANLIAVLVARTRALGTSVRQMGVVGAKRLAAYTSASAHGCIAQAIDLSGLGTGALRVISTNARHEIDLGALNQAIIADRKAGLTPFFIAATIGTVDVGAIDDLAALSEIARRESLWLHVDGAYGALGMLVPALAARMRGIERADSIAFDFHKWGQVPYDAGFILVRDAELHESTFAAPASYLRREERGLAGGSPWPCDFGPDLSRGFRALKTWFTLKAYGTQKLARVIEQTCSLAQYLEQRIEEHAELELAAPVSLNVVCFRYRASDSKRVNAEIVVALQEAGRVAPSSVLVNGHFAIRAAIVNHRTERADLDALIEQTLALGKRLTQAADLQEPGDLG